MQYFDLHLLTCQLSGWTEQCLQPLSHSSSIKRPMYMYTTYTYLNIFAIQKASEDRRHLPANKAICQLYQFLLGCNPMHTYLGVSPYEHSETYLWVGMNRIAQKGIRINFQIPKKILREGKAAVRESSYPCSLTNGISDLSTIVHAFAEITFQSACYREIWRFWICLQCNPIVLSIQLEIKSKEVFGYL